MTAKEAEIGLDITAALCGAIVLSKIQAGLGHEPILNAELAFRHIATFKDKTGVVKAIEQCTFTDKRHALRRHERGRLMVEKDGLIIEKDDDLKIVVPQSDELKEMLHAAANANQAANAANDDVV